MRTKDFERLLQEMGLSLLRSNGHKIWGNNSVTIAVPHAKEINKMVARRLLKEISYPHCVPQLNYKAA